MYWFERERERLIFLFHLFMYSLVGPWLFPDQRSNPQPWWIRTMLWPTEPPARTKVTVDLCVWLSACLFLTTAHEDILHSSDFFRKNQKTDVAVCYGNQKASLNNFSCILQNCKGLGMCSFEIICILSKNFMSYQMPNVISWCKVALNCRARAGGSYRDKDSSRAVLFCYLVTFPRGGLCPINIHPGTKV